MGKSKKEKSFEIPKLRFEQFAMQYILFDDHFRVEFLPLAYTRPVGDVRVGIVTVREKWDRLLSGETGVFAGSYLAPHFNSFVPGEAIWINGRLLPFRDDYPQLFSALGPKEYLLSDQGEVVAARFSTELMPAGELITPEALEAHGLKAHAVSSEDHTLLRSVTDLYRMNRQCMEYDFAAITQGRKSEGINDPHTVVYGKDNLFVEPGASIKAAIIDAESGPIYIGREATVQPGAIIQNAHAICEHAVVGMGAKLRGDTTVGPWSKVGGEIGNSVITGYSNKGHDGYLGNSVLGEWCNLGADTNTSNLKNNYADVRLWNYGTERFKDTGLMFCGLIMGDHSKCGINTMFNTGTVVGVSANIFGSGYPRNFIPSFSWGGAAGFTTYKTAKAFEVAEIVMGRRRRDFSDTDRSILTEVFELTAKYRRWEKKD
jgi:UDP-N-acetylglucosamine diphosphorylase/glucosamine-1-phosphate N-acetyltransferase